MDQPSQQSPLNRFGITAAKIIVSAKPVVEITSPLFKGAADQTVKIPIAKMANASSVQRYVMIQALVLLPLKWMKPRNWRRIAKVIIENAERVEKPRP